MNYDELISRESNYLCEYAAYSSSQYLTKRLIRESNQINIEDRLPFQRDRDRIIHSRAFRRLMHKTQVFNANLGDHYRNRLTHTLEVSQIARSISKYIGLNDELTEAIALGHDLGHTPFGHVGERTLHLIISGHIDGQEYNKNNYGGFKHNFQGLQIVDNIEKRSNEYNGLNLSFAVREGILKHTGSKIRIPKDIASRNFQASNKVEVSYSTLNLEGINIDSPSITLEGQVVGIADEIAQCTHDLEDGLRAKIITLQDIENDEFVTWICKEFNIDLRALKETVDVRNILINHMVSVLINDVCETSLNILESTYGENKLNIPKFQNSEDIYKIQIIKFSDRIEKMQNQLSKLITQFVIASQQVTQSDLKAEHIIRQLFLGYYKHPQQLPDYILNRYFLKKGKTYNRIIIEDTIEQLKVDGEFVRLICDHIGSMTDQFAAREYKKLYEPEFY